MQEDMKVNYKTKTFYEYLNYDEKEYILLLLLFIAYNNHLILLIFIFLYKYFVR